MNRPLVFRVLSVGAGAGIVLPLIVMSGLALGEGASQLALDAVDEKPSPPSSAPPSMALIFPTPTPDQPQPWSPDDGPLFPSPAPSTSAAPSRTGATAPSTTVDPPRSPAADRRAQPPVPRGNAADGGPTRGTTEPSPAPLPPVAPPNPEPERPDTAEPEKPSPPFAAEPHPIVALGMPEIVNRERLANGCGPIALDDELVAHAERHAVIMADSDTLFHSSQAEWPELIAAGYGTAVEVHEEWMAGEETSSIILDCSLTAIGVAAADGEDGMRYWIEVFR